MLYITIDPFLVSLPDMNANEEIISSFIYYLRLWSEFIKNNDQIQLRLSKECRDTLATSKAYPWGDVDLKKLLDISEKYRNAEKDVLSLVEPFLNNIYRDPFINDEIQKYRTDLLDWNITSHLPIEVLPEEFVIRILIIDIQEAFSFTLLNLVCTRQPDLILGGEIENIYIASPPIEKAENTTSVLIKSLVDFVRISSEQIFDEKRQIEESLIFVHQPSFLETLQIKEHIETVLDALKSAVKKYPNILISFPLTEKSAKEAPYENPYDIYEYLIGLVEIWLVYYRLENEAVANEKYYEKFRRRIKPTEGDTALQKFAEDYTVEYQGKTFSCGRHVVIGTGSNCARINFEVFKNGDEIKLLIARAGKHGRNKLKST